MAWPLFEELDELKELRVKSKRQRESQGIGLPPRKKGRPNTLHSPKKHEKHKAISFSSTKKTLIETEGEKGEEYHDDNDDVDSPECHNEEKGGIFSPIC